MTDERRPSPTLARILRVLDYIHDHADEDLSLDQLADVAALSRFHWHRVFTSTMGRSPADVIRLVRMHKATMLLVQTQLSVAEVGARVGYPNPGSFSRVFHAVYGATPTAFRKSETERHPVSPFQGVSTMYEVTLKTAPDLHLAAMAHQGPYSEISRAFQRLSAVLDHGGHWPNTRGMAGVYYDDPDTTPEAELTSHAGTIWVGKEVPDGLEAVTMKGGDFAVLTLKGPYSGLANAYRYLYGAWLTGSDATPADRPAFEVYLNSPMDTAPEDLLTEIYLPLV